MKILAINGSPNRTGSTAILLDLLLDTCSKAGAQCEKVNLEDYSILGCKNCAKCIKSGGCLQNDDFMQLKAKMLDADGIIVGSPYYGGKPTLQLKLFLDRLSISSATNCPFSGKYIVGVASSAVSDCRKLASYCANLGLIGIIGNGIVSGILYEGMVLPEGVKDMADDEEIRIKTRKIAKKLIEDIKGKQVPLKNKLKCFAFRKWPGRLVMRVCIRMDRLSNKVREYCEDKGWVKDVIRME